MREIGWMAFILFWLRVVLSLFLLTLGYQSGWVVALILGGISGYMMYGIYRDYKAWRDG